MMIFVGSFVFLKKDFLKVLKWPYKNGFTNGWSIDDIKQRVTPFFIQKFHTDCFNIFTINANIISDFKFETFLNIC